MKVERELAQMFVYAIRRKMRREYMFGGFVLGFVVSRLLQYVFKI
jgi:hypothetical protein